MEDAVTYCQVFESELLSYSNITKPSVLKTLNDRNSSKDGDSAWVSGYVTFSLPIVYRGCYENFVVFNPVELERKDIYSCINYCLNDIKFRYFSTEFFGITNTTCMCFNAMDLNIMVAVVDSRCDNECSAFDIDSCGGKGLISVYRLYKNGTILWDRNDPLQGQCVFVKLTDSLKRIKLLTASCFETSEKVSGYFCQHGAQSHLDRTCSVRDKTGRYCLVKTSSSRQSAKEGCLAENGVLAGHYNEQAIVELMQNNLYYWLGVQRAYTVTQTRTVFSTACLAVTKLNGALYLHPDECEKKKLFFCEAANSIGSSVAPVGSLGALKATTKRISSTNIKNETYISALDPSIGPLSPFALLAIVVAVLVYTIAIIVIVVRKNWHRDGGSNSNAIQTPQTSLKPYCIVNRDSVIHSSDEIL